MFENVFCGWIIIVYEQCQVSIHQLSSFFAAFLEAQSYSSLQCPVIMARVLALSGYAARPLTFKTRAYSLSVFLLFKILAFRLALSTVLRLVS